MRVYSSPYRPGASQAPRWDSFLSVHVAELLCTDKTPFVSTGSLKSLLRLPRANTTSSQWGQG